MERTAVGRQIGPYIIERRLGAGGMGEVFQARDTRLHRSVALKTLPLDRAHDSDHKRRLFQEARAASALNHPNIVTLHDIISEQGIDWLVMEYVPGESLDKLIAGIGLPLNQVIEYGSQIAAALAAAHTAGIIHRDIKPANVIVTPESLVKVLDFGLAKELQDATDPDRAITQTAAVMGTVAYMSPEQTKARPLDRRTDIFSLGVVLYEMSSGKRPFDRESAAETMHAIIHEPIPPLPEAARAIDAIVEKALEKDPNDRYQHASDLAVDLRRLHRRSQTPAVATNIRSGRRDRRWLGWLGAAVAVVSVIAFVFWGRHEAATGREPIKFSFEPPEDVTLVREGFETSVSPDGRKVAFVGQPAIGPTALWIRSLDQQESQKVVGTDGAIGPFWSPDGGFIGFFADGKLKKVPAAGGVVQNICTTTPGLGASWGSSGEIVFNPINRAPLMHVPASGGTPQPLTSLDASRQENSHRWPTFLPDGRHFLFTARSNEKENTAIYVGSLDDRRIDRLVTEQSNAGYAAPGYLLFAHEGTLMAQPFDAATLIG